MKNTLKIQRARRDWTQADVAERLGVSRQTVNALETGYRHHWNRFVR